MKKKVKWLIWIGSFVLLAVLSISVSVFISKRSRDPVFDPAPLIGLTKEEVLELAFDQYPKNGRGELNILVHEINQYGNTSYVNRYYKNLEEAKNDARLMGWDVWETNGRKKFSLSLFQIPVEYYVFYFEDGKVVNVETTIWYME